MNAAFSIVLLFIPLDCMTNKKPPCAKGCHVPLTAFYQPVKALLLPFDKLYDEFCDHQTLPDECFSDNVLKEAKVIDGEEDGEVLLHYRVGVLWWHIAQLVIPGTAAKRFKQYNTIQFIKLVLPNYQYTDFQLHITILITLYKYTSNYSK